mmetsp:Transcript_37633/g.120921  ORF Transcript_37633/g.120921 Transcript_37633/m.120921 type:complete len:226 (-) Transcript_37633:85-762(-)
MFRHFAHLGRELGQNPHGPLLAHAGRDAPQELLAGRCRVDGHPKRPPHHEVVVPLQRSAVGDGDRIPHGLAADKLGEHGLHQPERPLQPQQRRAHGPVPAARVEHLLPRRTLQLERAQLLERGARQTVLPAPDLVRVADHVALDGHQARKRVKDGNERVGHPQILGSRHPRPRDLDLGQSAVEAVQEGSMPPPPRRWASAAIDVDTNLMVGVPAASCYQEGQPSC